MICICYHLIFFHTNKYFNLLTLIIINMTLKISGCQSLVTLASGKSMIVEKPTSAPYIPPILNSRLHLFGTISIPQSGIELKVNQGGDLSQGTLNIHSDSTVSLNGYAARLSS
jgi:hypothetical protein